MPVEPPHLQVTLVSPTMAVDDLIPLGLTNRPELASRRALVQAAVERTRQERVRPLLPNVILEGRNGAGSALNGTVFGGGPDDGPHLFGGRFDADLGVIWTLNNLGAGNRSLVRQRQALEQQASIEFADQQDRVAEEVVQAHAQLAASAAEVDAATIEVKEAVTTFNGTLVGLTQTRTAGNLFQLVNRPQEAVAALQQVFRAYEDYYAAVNGYNRAQFQLYRALGFPARIVICDRPLGDTEPVDTARPAPMAPVCPYMRSNPCP